MLQIKKRAFTESEDTVFPLTFNLTNTCSGVNNLDITLIANSILGGVAPYVISTNAFTDSASALANTDWTSGTSRNFEIGDVPNTYWVVIRDDAGTLELNSITVDCWDSLTATRTQAFRSTVGNTVAATTCGYSASVSCRIASRTGDLAIGDRVFTTLTGNTPFNGTTGMFPTPSYWKFNPIGITNPCASESSVQIDADGFITDIHCC
jgi:hypothetical protein